MTEAREPLLRQAADAAIEHLAGLPDRAVAPTPAALAALAALPSAVPEHGRDASEVLRELAEVGPAAESGLGARVALRRVHAAAPWRPPPPPPPADEGAAPPLPAARMMAVGLNPALQKTRLFDAPWARGKVNRAARGTTAAGGKGQHFAVAAARLRRPARSRPSAA